MSTPTRSGCSSGCRDGTPSSTAAPRRALYELFEDALWKRTFTDELEPTLFARFYEWAGAERVAGLYTIIDEPRARWWDDISTVDRRETRDEIYALAADDARRALAETYGGDTATWTTVHRAAFAHPLGEAGAGRWPGRSVAARCRSPATARR